MGISNKKVIKNTIILYFRMMIVVVVTLYTSRIVLDGIGVVNFGIYTVVAGFVVMLGFVQGAMINATQRYYSFDLGQNDGSNLSGIFTSSVNIHLAMIAIIVVLAETVGLMFVSTLLNVPAERYDSALIAFHLAIFSFCTTVIYTPFAAMLMANEKMGIYAGISVFDVFIKLILMTTLSEVNYDKLVVYSLYILLSNALVLFVYLLVWKIYFRNLKYQMRGRTDFSQMLSFTGWNLFGNLASVLSNQGVNVLLNVLFNPVVNASRGISMQVGSAMNNFSGSLQSALNPQIVKTFASGDYKKMHDLVVYGAKYNFFMVLIIACPIYVNIEYLLNVWLVEVPNYTVIFCQLVVINFLVDSASGTLMTSAQATGKIKLYQVVVGGTLLLNIPLSYIILLVVDEPYIVGVVSISLSFIAIFVRLYINGPLINLSPKIFLVKVVSRMMIIMLMCTIAKVTVFVDGASGFLSLFLYSTLSVLFCLSSIYVFGLEARERSYIKNITVNAYKRTFS